MRFKLVNYIVSVFFLIILRSLTAQEPIRIGQSRSQFATAFTNTRKIVRAGDDRLLVVFEDIVNDTSFIKYTFSSDHVIWSEPEILCKGISPALAIDTDSNVHFVCVGGDSSFLRLKYYDWDSWSEETIIIVDSITTYRYPSIECTGEYVSIVWQGTSPEKQNDRIYYQKFKITSALSPASSIFGLSPDSLFSEKPVITGDLFYYHDFVPIHWTSYSQKGSQIYGTALNPTLTTSDTSFLPSLAVHGTENKFAPTVSLQYIDFLLSYSDVDSGNVFVTMGMIWPGTLEYCEGPLVIETGLNPSPSLDDVIAHSCALLWCDNNEIFYSQIINMNEYPASPVQVSSSSSYEKMYPNVCYREFRENYFDVIWSEKIDTDLYNIMYRRMDKVNQYNDIAAPRSNTENAKFELYQNYPNPFNQSTTIYFTSSSTNDIKVYIYNSQGQIVRKFHYNQNNMKSGEIIWDGKNNHNQHVPSGVYLARAICGDEICTIRLIAIK